MCDKEPLRPSTADEARGKVFTRWGSPGLPRFEALRRKAWGARMLVKGALPRLQCLPQLGFPARTACVSHLGSPIDQREPVLFSPLPPQGGEGRVCPITFDAFPPEVHQGRQGWNLLATLRYGSGPG